MQNTAFTNLLQKPNSIHHNLNLTILHEMHLQQTNTIKTGRRHTQKYISTVPVNLQWAKRSIHINEHSNS